MFYNTVPLWFLFYETCLICRAYFYLNTAVCFFGGYHTWCCNIAVWCCIICCWADRPWFCCCSNCCICWGSNPCWAAIIIRGCWLPELSSMALFDLTLRLAALWLEVGELGVGERELRTRWAGLLSSASWQRGECPCKRWKTVKRIFWTHVGLMYVALWKQNGSYS